MRPCAECRFDLSQVKVKITLSHFVSMSKFCVWSVSFEPIERNLKKLWQYAEHKYGLSEIKFGPAHGITRLIKSYIWKHLSVWCPVCIFWTNGKEIKTFWQNRVSVTQISIVAHCIQWLPVLCDHVWVLAISLHCIKPVIVLSDYDLYGPEGAYHCF
jgi:hypothetical protein